MTQTPPIRLSTLADLVAAVPVLVGYVPGESLVVATLRGPRRRTGLTMCVPLPPLDSEDELAAALVAPARRSDATTCLFVVYSDTASDATVSALVEALIDRFLAAGIEVADAVVVRRGRWRSYDCDDWSCCPPEGQPVPPPPAALRAAAVASGRAVLPDRDALVASIAPVTGERAVRLRACLQRMSAEPVGDREAALALVARGVEAVAEGRPPDDEATARLVVTFDDLLLRDAVLAGVASPADGSLLAFLVHVVRLSVPPFDAQVAAMLAWVAYAEGDGALANVALDRALGTDPGHRLAGLVRLALDAATPPAALRELSVAARADVEVALGRRADRRCA